MNAAVVLGLHGSLQRILDKAGGNAAQVSELLMLRKYSERFGRVFVLSHDSRSFSELLPGNCTQIRLRNRPVFVASAWIVLLFLSWRKGVSVIRLVGPSALPAVFITGWLVRARIVIMYYYLWFNTASGLKRALLRALERTLLTPVDYVIAANREVARFCKGRKMLDAGEGIITGAFDPARVRADASVRKLGGTRLIFVGRLAKVKDPLTLIRGFNIARRSMPSLRLVVCGDGELMEECRRLAGGGVVFKGFAGNVPSLLKASDIYVITSAYDASPRSLMEAMCMGLPCIATAVGGVPEYLPADCGILVKPGDAEALATAIAGMASDRKRMRTMGKRARRHVLEHHDLSKNLGIELDFMAGKAGRAA